MRRDDVASTSMRRHFHTKCPLGIFVYYLITIFFYLHCIFVCAFSVTIRYNNGQGKSTKMKNSGNVNRTSDDIPRLQNSYPLSYRITRPRGYKTFFILSSVEHEILNAHNYKNIKKFGLFNAQLSLECYFSRSYMLKCQQLLAF